jgi:hypothetical protein
MNRCLHPTCKFPNKRVCCAQWKCPEFVPAIQVTVPHHEYGHKINTGLTLEEAYALDKQLQAEIGKHLERKYLQEEEVCSTQGSS